MIILHAISLLTEFQNIFRESIEIGIKALDESRKRDQEEFLKKVEELVKEIKQFKEKLMIDSHTFEKNVRDLLNETHKAYDVGYTKLQFTIKDLQKKNFV